MADGEQSTGRTKQRSALRAITSLAGMGGRERVRDLGAELLASDQLARGPIVDELVRIGTKARPRGSEAWAQLAQAAHLLNPESRLEVVLAGNGHWAKACRELCTSALAGERLAAASVGALCDDPGVISALPELLADKDQAVVNAATTALLAQLGRLSQITTPEQTRLAIEQAINVAIGSFDRHRRRDVLAGVLGLLSTPSRARACPQSLRSWLGDESQIGLMAVRSVIKRGAGAGGPGTQGGAGFTEPSAEPVAVHIGKPLAWMLMSYQLIAGACVDRLMSPGSLLEQEEWLSFGHLMQNPRRAVRLRAAAQSLSSKSDRSLSTSESAREVFRLGLSDEALEMLSTRSTLRAAAILSILADQGQHAPGLGATASGFAASGSALTWGVLEPLLGDSRPLCRLALLRAVREHSAPLDLLLDLSMDASETIATSALRSVSLPGVRDRVGRKPIAAIMHRARSSPSASVRASASNLIGIHDHWQHDRAESRLLARRMLRADHDGFVLGLRARLLDGAAHGPGDRVDAILLAQKLGLAIELAPDMMGVVQASLLDGAESSPAELRVVAAAVTALARLGTPDGIEVVRRAVESKDARVRANAVDGLGRRLRLGLEVRDRSSLLDRVVELKFDAHHRVRASAVRAELDAAGPSWRGRSEAAAEAITPMLNDTRAMHRIAGLWLTERVSGVSGIQPDQRIITRVTQLMGSDPAKPVRERAKRCAARLVAVSTSEWIGTQTSSS